METGPDRKNKLYEALCECISQYIEDCGYTWTLDDVIEHYYCRQRGEYISFTAKEIQNKFGEELKHFLK